MTYRSDAKLTEEGVQFIIWAKKQGKTLEWIENKLAEYADIEISKGRISQVWKKDGKKRNIPKENPYAELMEGDEDLEDKEEEDSSIVSGVEDKLAKRKNIISSDILSKTFSEPQSLNEGDIDIDEIAPINLQAILKTSGLKPPKQNQIIDIFEMTDSTPSELARVLDVCNVTYSVQKQILASAYGLNYAQRILLDRKGGTPKTTKPQDQISSAVSQATSMLTQKLRSKQAQLAFAEVNDLLKRVDSDTKGESTEDPLKLAKDLAALKMISGNDNSLGEKVTDALLDNALKKDDNSLIEGIKLMMDMNKGEGKGDNSMLMLYQKELSELRQHSTTTQQDMMNKIIDLQMNNLTNTKDSDEKLNVQIRKLEQEKMELLTSQLRDKVEGSIRSPEEWMQYMHNMLETGKQMGLVQKGEVTDPEQATSIERLKTAENLIESIPDKMNAGFDSMLNRAESTMLKYMEFQEKREQRQMNQSQRGQGIRNSPRNVRTPSDRTDILNSIEDKVNDLEVARDERKKLRSLY